MIDHPGIILEREYMNPLGLSANKLAAKLRVPQNRISLIIKGQRSISPDTAVRLSLFFKNKPIAWLIMQAKYDLDNTPSPNIRGEHT